MRRSFKKLVRKSIAALPAPLRAPVFRRMIRFSPQLSPRLKIEIAESHSDRKQAFRILHDSYVQEGFMKPHPSGMRTNGYFNLPGARTLVAKWDDRVVATSSAIPRTALGLPLEKVFDLNALTASNKAVIEISGLAIAPEFRSKHDILFHLIRLLTELYLKGSDVAYAVIAVNPRDRALYEDILLFERLPEALAPEYDFANGAPAVGYFLDIRAWPERLGRVYGGAPAHRNLFSFLMSDSRAHTQSKAPQIFQPTLQSFQGQGPDHERSAA